jgi:hypothetical protein
MGRFVSPDPLGYVDGPSMYGFAGNDPVNLSDPTGQSLLCLAYPEFCEAALRRVGEMAEAIVTLPVRAFREDKERREARIEALTESGYEAYEQVLRQQSTELRETTVETAKNLIPGRGSGRAIGTAIEACTSPTASQEECGSASVDLVLSVGSDVVVVGGAVKAARGAAAAARPGLRRASARSGLEDAALGNRAHYDVLNGGSGQALPTELSQVFQETEFYFARRGEKGPDVVVTGGKHPSEYPDSMWPSGVDYADFKPVTESGARTFAKETRNGKLPEEAIMLGYDPATGKLAW